jgi:hypothetical protein
MKQCFLMKQECFVYSDSKREYKFLKLYVSNLTQAIPSVRRFLRESKEIVPQTQFVAKLKKTFLSNRITFPSTFPNILFWEEIGDHTLGEETVCICGWAKLIMWQTLMC